MARRGHFCAEKEDVRRRNGGKAGVLPLGTRRGAAVTGTAKQRCGVAKPWPRSGQPHRVVSRSEMPRAILRGKPKRRDR